MIYVFFALIIIMMLLIGLHIFMTYSMMMDFCSLMAKVERTYDIVNKWAIYYVCEEWDKGNNKPFDFIFPNDREIIEEKMKQDECHIDSEKE